jgi:peptide/nickel transport system substrate-binding protein
VEAFVIGWGTPYHPDTSLFGPFHSSQVLAEGGSNLGSYVNPAVDAALEAGKVAQDEAAEVAAYTQFQEAIAADPPYVWLVYLRALNAFPADFVGPTERTLEHHGYGLFWNVETWHWE